MVDLTQYLDSSPSIYNSTKTISEVDSFEHYAILYKNRWQPDIRLMVRYLAEDVLPIANYGRSIMMYLPEGSNAIPIYETPQEGITLKFGKPPVNIPNWEQI